MFSDNEPYVWRQSCHDLVDLSFSRWGRKLFILSQGKGSHFCQWFVYFFPHGQEISSTIKPYFTFHTHVRIHAPISQYKPSRNTLIATHPTPRYPYQSHRIMVLHLDVIPEDILFLILMDLSLTAVGNVIQIITDNSREVAIRVFKVKVPREILYGTSNFYVEAAPDFAASSSSSQRKVKTVIQPLSIIPPQLLRVRPIDHFTSI